MLNVYLTEAVRVENFLCLRYERKYRLDYEGTFSSCHVLLRTKPHDNSHLKLNVFCQLTAVTSKLLVTGTVHVRIYSMQPDGSQYALAFAKVTAQFVPLPSYN
jgi:hypothetical protein